MKSRTMIRTVAAAGVTFMAACSDTVHDPFVPVERSDPLIETIIALGFRPDMILDHGTYFLVEGDIEISKQELLESADTNFMINHAPQQQKGSGDTPSQESPWPHGPPVLFQWRTNALVSQQVAPQIRVNVSGAESSWRTAALAAMAEWNAIHPQAIINLVSGSSADVTISMTNSLPFNGCGPGSGTTVASASFPSGGRPGSTIRISNQVTSQCNLSASQKKHNMAHEIGHTLGFRHTNWMARGEQPGSVGAVLIPETPSTDAQSVMNGGTALNSWNGFSGFDKVAAFQMYPPLLMVSGGISGPTTAQRNQSYTWSVTPASGGTGQYTYNWTIQCIFGPAFSIGFINSITITPADYCPVEPRMQILVSVRSGVRDASYGSKSVGLFPLSD